MSAKNILPGREAFFCNPQSSFRRKIPFWNGLCYVIATCIVALSFGFSADHEFKHNYSRAGYDLWPNTVVFSGFWEIDTTKSELAGRHANAASSIAIKQGQDSIRFERQFYGLPLTIETLPLNGDSIIVKLTNTRMAVRSMKWSVNGDTLIVESHYNLKYPFQKLSELYCLLENGKSMNVTRHFYSDKKVSVKAFYNRRK